MSIFGVILWTGVMTMSVRKSIGSMDSFYFDVNDILNENLMPASLFRESEKLFTKGSNITRKEFFNSGEKTNNFSAAYTTMDYHRKMMNEYQATNFLAKQVFVELVEPSSPQQIQRRLGILPKEEMDTLEIPRVGKILQKDEMLYDPGSSGYKNWLEKTTTLDDIQRQMSEAPLPGQNKSGVRKRKRLHANRRQGGFSDEDLEEYDYDEGDVTGFAYHRSAVNHAPVSVSDFAMPYAASSNNQKFDAIIPTAVSKNGYSYQPTGHETYEEYGPQTLQTQTKEIGFKDIMDIALTTLAYLAFGMFVLQVLMCITMNKEDSSNLMMMPMEADMPDMETEEIRRRKRSINESLRLQKMNELSRRVLLSIETVMRMPKDDGQCHYKLLCENNKFAINQKDGQKIWMPIWK